jgi:putative transposase
MILARDFWIHVNLKKVRRIMKKLKLATAIRTKNKYRLVLASNEEHKAVPNLLKQQFKISKTDQVYSTDITYLNYGDKRAFLSATKDLGNNEIVHYNVSERADMSIVLKGLHERLSQLSKKQRRSLTIHSDQGSHYTSATYRSLLSKLEVVQSMSRKGNCLDNAPIESFFGHLKDEIILKDCKNYEEVRNEVEMYIEYYNNNRPQWGLKGKTPVECRG